MRSAELCRIPPNVDERGSAYLLWVRELWQDRTAEDPVVSDTIEMLFRGAVEASLSPSVQSTLKKWVGLTNLTYALWAAHVTQYIDNEIEEREQERKDLVSLQAQLAKSHLKDMRDKVNQNKTYAKQMSQQAPPSAMQSQPPPVSYGPYPQQPPYPHQPAALQSRLPFRNKRKRETLRV